MRGHIHLVKAIENKSLNKIHIILNSSSLSCLYETTNEKSLTKVQTGKKLLLELLWERKEELKIIYKKKPTNYGEKQQTTTEQNEIIRGETNMNANKPMSKFVLFGFVVVCLCCLVVVVVVFCSTCCFVRV